MALSLKPSAFAQVPDFPSVALVHSNRCGWCHRFMPEYNRFATEYGTLKGSQATDDVPLVTKIDAGKYTGLRGGDFPVVDQEVQGFPTTLFFDGKGNYAKYQGERTAEGLKAGWLSFQSGEQEKKSMM